MSDVTILPDGSAFATVSMPLPKDHWLTNDGGNVPPMPMRVGKGAARSALADMVRTAAKYAIRASTMNGKDSDFDPDAMVQNMVVGLLGYWTEDGTSGDSWDMPSPVPPLFSEAADEIERLTAERDAANAVIEELIVALQHHQEQTRPIHGTQIALDAARALRKGTT